MSEQNSSTMETGGHKPAGRTGGGWGSWALWVSALAAAGALSYLLGAAMPVAEVTLPPAAMTVFGVLAGAVLGFALRRQFPPARLWILASSMAGFLAALVSVLTTALTDTPEGLLAGWAYAWAAYGAVLGMMLQRISPRRWLMLASVAGWAAAGIVSGMVGWALDVVLTTETIPTTAFYDVPDRTWSLVGLGVAGGVCGATGAAITGAALMLLLRLPVLPQDAGAGKKRDTRVVKVAGAVCGLLAAVLCTYLGSLVLAMLLEGSLDSFDLTIYFLSAMYGTPVCVPTIALVSIPLSIGCGYVGLEIARAIGRQNPRLWVWCGAAVGGVAGYVLGSLVAFALGHMRA